MKENSKKYCVFFALIILSCTAFAQSSRSYIRQQIEKWGECRNVAITKSNGDLALHAKNGCARSGCPSDLNAAITELNNAGEFIDDVQLTDEGKWLILYGDNGLRWNEIPYSLEKKLRDYNKKSEVITSVTFNDADQWIIITTNYISASETWIQDWLAEGNKTYGKLWAACITDDAMVAVYEDGFKTYGEVPDNLEEELKKAKIDIYRLKISGAAWFFADKEGHYRYNM